MSQYHKAIFIQNLLGKILTRTYWRQLLNLSNPEKSVVSAGKLFHILTIRKLRNLRLLELKHRCLCNIMRDRVIVTGFLE